MEREIGGSSNNLFNLVNYLPFQQIARKEVFSEHFSPDSVTNSNDPASINVQFEELVKELKKPIKEDVDKLLLLPSFNR